MRLLSSDSTFLNLVLTETMGPVPLFSSAGMAGEINNALMYPAELLPPKACSLNDFISTHACTGIANTAMAILNSALPHDDRLRAVVKTVDVTSRTSGVLGVVHDAVLVTTTNDRQLVFDWHATLDPWHPLITPYEDWR